MAEPAQATVGPALQPAVVPVATTPLNMGPLRLDSMDGAPSSGKMVSLADLHVNTNTPGIGPGLLDTHGIDAFDPLLQHLLRDNTFCAAVQTSQLHAAAAAAVKVLRNFGPQMGGFKRPADRRHGSRDYPSDGFRGSPSYAGMGSGVRSMKQEVLQLEEAIPWTCVRRNWRSKRTGWRKLVKQTELVSDFAARLKELRTALLADDHTFVGCGPAWRSHLESCIQGRGSAAALVSVWDEMKNTIRSWLSGSGAISGPAGGFVTPSGPAPSADSAGRAVLALQRAVKHGSTEALLQAPLESIMGHDGCSLHAVRQAIELERRVVSSRLASLQSNGVVGGSPALHDQQGNGNGGSAAVVVSYFSSIAAGWEDSDFDSGAETEMEDGSDATDLDSDFDA
ncbi:hypothetical protein Ndes2526B_g06499 [Nannochloris sp. 'desiccata']